MSGINFQTFFKHFRRSGLRRMVTCLSPEPQMGRAAIGQNIGPVRSDGSRLIQLSGRIREVIKGQKIPPSQQMAVQFFTNPIPIFLRQPGPERNPFKGLLR